MLMEHQLHARTIFKVFNKIFNNWYDIGSTLTQQKETMSHLHGGTSA